MPVELLSAAERDRLSRLPPEIPREDLAAHFRLTHDDRAVIDRLRGGHNRLGFALQLAAVRYLGFVPADLDAVPREALRYLAEQVGTEPEALKDYGTRPKTVRTHLQAVLDHLRFRRAAPEDIERLETWLTQRALEHDRPALLVEADLEKLRRERVLRPGLTVVERVVAAARARAHAETLRRLAPILTDAVKAMLDSLLVPEQGSHRTRLAWLRRNATANTPEALLGVLEKLEWLFEHGVGGWDLSSITPNRLKLLARLGRRYTNQALQRAVPERRYPILLAFLKQTLVDTVDEAVDVYDACLAGVFARSKRALRAHDEAVARSAEEKVRLFHRIGQLILDPGVQDRDLRMEIFRRVPPLELAAAVDEAEAITHPEGRAFFDFLDKRYAYVRQFAPAFLEVMPLKSNPGDDPVMEAVEMLRVLNREGRRKVPPDLPNRFVPKPWKPFVFDRKASTDGSTSRVNRHGWEFCVLSELRGRLRSGDIFAEPSSRYADPETYLIEQEAWPRLRQEACEQLGLTTTGRERIAQRVRELTRLLQSVDHLLTAGKPNGTSKGIRLEAGDLVVPAFEAQERPPSVAALEEAVSTRLPAVDLTDLLIEVDTWTGFSRHLTHGSGVTQRSPQRTAELMPYLYVHPR